MATIDRIVGGSERFVRYASNGDVTSDTTSYFPILGRYIETRPDRVRSRKPTGWLYPKGYSLSVNSYRYPIGERRTFDSQGRLQTYQSGCCGSWTTTPVADVPPIPAGTENRLITRALLQLKDQRVNIGVALGESVSTARTLGSGISAINETADFLGSSLTRLAQAGRAFKKGQWKKAAKILKVPPPVSVPKNWLALQYGWMPLLNDIKGACDELIVGIPQKPPIVTVKSKYRKSDNYVAYQTVGNVVNRLDRVASAGGYLRLDYEPGNNFLQTAARLGLMNPAEVAWELVPFSFVADWVSPIGDFLSCLDAAVGWNFKSGSYSTFRRCRTGFTYHHSLTVRETGSWQGSRSKVEMNRKVYVSSPLPSNPGIKNPFSAKHLANGLALVATVFK